MKLPSGRHQAAIAAALILIAILIVVSQTSESAWLQARQWGTYVQAMGLPGVVLVLFIGLLATSVGLPRQLLAFVAGFAYGVLPGLLISLPGAVAGCALTCIVARLMLASWLRKRYPKPIATLHDFVRQDLFLKVLFLRLQPFGTNLLTNLCAGLLRLPMSTFLVASAIGYIPQMLVFCLLGAGVRVGSVAQLWVSGALMVSSLTLGWFLYRRHRRVHSI